MQIKKYLSQYKKSLFTVNSEPLTKLSKLFLLIFVLFCFWIIGLSLSNQSSQIDRPTVKFNYKCTSLVDEDYFIDIYTFEQYSTNSYYRYNRYNRNNYSYKRKQNKPFGTYEKCESLRVLYMNAQNIFKPIVKEIRSYNRQISLLDGQIRKLENEYGNMLLEKMAKQKRSQSILSSNNDEVKSKIENLKINIENFKKKVSNLEDIKNIDEYKKFIKFVEENRDLIQSEFSKHKKYYSLKVLASKYAFLIPLFFIVFFIYNIALKRTKYILSHLLVNLLNVVGIFILIYLIEFIYSIIPHVLFAKFFALLHELNILAFANYISIAFFVIVFGLVIKFIQNRALRQKELKSIQLTNSYVRQGKCHKCGASKNSEHKYCPSCGESLYEECKSCKKPRVKNSKFCQECGAA